MGEDQKRVDGRWKSKLERGKNGESNRRLPYRNERSKGIFLHKLVGLRVLGGMV